MNNFFFLNLLIDQIIIVVGNLILIMLYTRFGMLRSHDFKTGFGSLAKCAPAFKYQILNMGVVNRLIIQCHAHSWAFEGV
jgi:hypothetical protein